MTSSLIVEQLSELPLGLQSFRRKGSPQKTPTKKRQSCSKRNEIVDEETIVGTAISRSLKNKRITLGMNRPMLTATQIHCHAKRFTEILKCIIEQNDHLVFVFGSFPKGGCRESSRLFGFVLAEMSFPTTYVVGRHVDHPETEHAWLQFDASSGSGIIDLTCCQFYDCDLQCPYVSESSEWHHKHWQIELQEDVANLTPANGMVPELDILSQMRREMDAV